MRCLLRLALAISHILLDKGNHPLGMPSDPNIVALLMSLPFILSSGNRYVDLSGAQIIAYCQPLAAVNTFTEHHGSGWSVKDMQHTFVFRHCLALSSKLTIVSGS